MLAKLHILHLTNKTGGKQVIANIGFIRIQLVTTCSLDLPVLNLIFVFYSFRVGKRI